MSISDAIIEEVRNRADLAEIVSDYTRLKRSGRTFRGPCPLHGGKGPNFSVDPERNVFKCFTCGEGGDLFSFPMKHLGMSFIEAVRWVAERVGVVVPDSDPRDHEPDPYADLHEANAFAAEWFRARLLDPEAGREAREYLARRGIKPEVCERFGIGWAPESWSELADAARTHGIRREVLLGLGLLKESSKSTREPYDAFRGRIIFPIQDLGGKTVAFGGRVIAAVEEHVPRYLNSPESPVYHKGELLFGLRWSRGVIRKEQVALVVEGYMDYVSLASHGIENVVAPLGTAMTPTQAELISRYAPRVILLYDSDTAGLKATFRAGDELLRSGVEVLVATLPDGEDPDSLVRSGGAVLLRRYLADAVDVLERKIQILERKDYFSNIAGKRRAVDKLLPTVRAASDEVLRGLYVSRVAERTGVPRETVEREVAEGDGGRRRNGRAGSHGAAPAPSAPQGRRGGRGFEPQPAATRMGAERNVILLLLRDEQWIEKVARRIGVEDFRDGVYREVFAELLHLHGEGRPREGSEWLRGLSESAVERVQELLGDPEGMNLADPGRFFEENVRDILARDQRARLSQGKREVGRAPEDLQVSMLQNARDLRVEIERSGGVVRQDTTSHSGRDDEPR
ncbi:MAG TPA: DNA primase [Longimicrobiaceae bacterium]|nr:DNA primase [Longimicrobiaceae bacterium]